MLLVAFLDSHRLITLFQGTLVCVQSRSILRRGDSDICGVLEQPQINHSMPEYAGVCVQTLPLK